MNYSESAYFDRAHVAHCAAWAEHRRLITIAQAQSRLALRAMAARQAKRHRIILDGKAPI